VVTDRVEINSETLTKEATGQFVGYASASYDGKFVPVATANTQSECFNKTVRRALAMCLIRGETSVQLRDDISAEDYSKLHEVLEKTCKEMGLEQ